MYKILKTLIENGKYERRSMLRKLDIYLLVNRINNVEYKELFNMFKKV